MGEEVKVVVYAGDEEGEVDAIGVGREMTRGPCVRSVAPDAQGIPRVMRVARRSRRSVKAWWPSDIRM